MLAWCFQSTAPRNWALARWLHLALSGLEGLQALDFRNTSLKDPWPLSTLAALESLVSCRGLTGVSLTELVEGQQRSLEIGHKRVGDLWLLHCPELNGSGLEAGSSDWISIPNLGITRDPHVSTSTVLDLQTRTFPPQPLQWFFMNGDVEK